MTEYVCSIGLNGSTFHRTEIAELKVDKLFHLRLFLEANPEIYDLSFSRMVDGESEDTIVKNKIDGKVSNAK